jgi:regulator of sirC expression with transglutaminase-like and TPR domain
MSARDRFFAEISKPDRELNLAKAALHIAQLEYPDLDVEIHLQQLDLMGCAVKQRLPATRYPLKIVQTINSYLYEELGFVGNESDYYNPQNSFLNDVLNRRTGIPITLALVYLEIADRIDFPMVGVGMPGHFIIRPNIEDVEIFVDAFDCGEILFAEDCRQKLIKLYQQEILSLPASVLQPVTKHQILFRMLNNLQAIYLERADFNRALAIKDSIELLSSR